MDFFSYFFLFCWVEYELKNILLVICPNLKVLKFDILLFHGIPRPIIGYGEKMSSMGLVNGTDGSQVTFFLWYFLGCFQNIGPKTPTKHFFEYHGPKAKKL